MLVGAQLLGHLCTFFLGLEEPQQQVSNRYPVTETCLGCICEGASNCNLTLGCTGDVCGLFRITWAYWADAGKPVIDPSYTDTDGGYTRCANDFRCAAQTVKNYVERFAQDCNNDGYINCYDYALIHRLGGYGCAGSIDPAYLNRYTACQQAVSSQGNNDLIGSNNAPSEWIS